MCRKRFSSKLMSTHLTEHLNRIFGRNADNSRDINENLNETNIETRSDSCETPEQYSQLLPQIEIKDEPPFVDHSDNDSNWSANDDGMANNFSDNEEEEEVLSDVSVKTPKRKSKRIKNKKCVQKKSKKSSKSKSKQLLESAENSGNFLVFSSKIID